jgi:hypothetical protein
MGIGADAKIAAWQDDCGIEPTTGERAKLLNELSYQAYETIKMIQLEGSGIRGGNGKWQGTDEFYATISSLGCCCEYLMEYDRKVTKQLLRAQEATPDYQAFLFLKTMDELELSVRSSNCLRNDGIVYVGDLVQRTETEMLRIPHFGRKSLDEIKEVLGQMGLHLGMTVPDHITNAIAMETAGESSTAARDSDDSRRLSGGVLPQEGSSKQ